VERRLDATARVGLAAAVQDHERRFAGEAGGARCGADRAARADRRQQLAARRQPAAGALPLLVAPLPLAAGVTRRRGHPAAAAKERAVLRAAIFAPLPPPRCAPDRLHRGHPSRAPVSRLACCSPAAARRPRCDTSRNAIVP
ncbi:hypothetical protein EMIHUDRAFT_433712, partial [Emiliania huxleyi CCMP1516]